MVGMMVQVMAVMGATEAHLFSVSLPVTGLIRD
jgi:hypothetical protein